MNCYFHPETVSVATCSDCNIGLCKSCADRYSFPICKSCNIKRGKTEKKRIFTEFAWMIGFSILGIYIESLNPSSWSLFKEHPIIAGVAFFYVLSGVIAGWYSLNKLTSKYFLFLPLIGWVIYLIIKINASFFLGLVILPFRIIKNIKRLKIISHIKD